MYGLYFVQKRIFPLSGKPAKTSQPNTHERASLFTRKVMVMSLSTQDYLARLRLIYQQMEQLSHTAGLLPSISEPQLRRVLQYAVSTVPEFEECWNDISVWIETLTTFLERYHTLASQFLEEEETLKVPALTPKGVYEQEALSALHSSQDTAVGNSAGEREGHNQEGYD